MLMNEKLRPVPNPTHKSELGLDGSKIVELSYQENDDICINGPD